MTETPTAEPMAALRRAYRRGETSPSAVMEAALTRLGDPDQSGAWISTVDPDRAMEAARALEARRDAIDALPLYGQIFSVKDNIDAAGVPTTAACPAFAYTPDRSATVVERALAAGALYLGKTNLDQFATGLVGVRTPYGVARNPRAPAYIPGGSSSGAAVSVATGLCGFAIGSDTGGSGRVPASCTGIVGLKPAPGALSRRGMLYACRSFDTATVFAAGPSDALRAFDALAAHDPEDPYSDAARPAWRKAQADPSTARIAVPRADQRDFFGDPDTPGLFDRALARAAACAERVEEVDFAPFLALNDLMFFGPFLAERDVSVGDFVRANPDACIPAVRDLILGSARFTAADAYRAAYAVADARAALRPFWERHDALMVPTVGRPTTLAEAEADPFGPSFRNGRYTNYANPLGLAAVAVPAGANRDGAPWGVTFLAPAGSEAWLCRLAVAFLG